MTQRDHDWLSETLSAYVDGELNATERSEVERRVRTDPEARALLTELQRTSALIHSLPRHTAPASVLDEIERHVERHALIGAPARPVAAPRRRGRSLVAISGLAAAIAVCVGGWWYLGLDGAGPHREIVAVRGPNTTERAVPSDAEKKKSAPGADDLRMAMRRSDSPAGTEATSRARSTSPSPAPLRAEGASPRADHAADAATSSGRETTESPAFAGAAANVNTIRLRVEVPDDATRDRVLAAVRNRAPAAPGLAQPSVSFKSDARKQIAPSVASRADASVLGVSVDRDGFRGIVQSVGGSTDGRVSVSLTRGDSRWEGLAAVDTAVEALFPARSAGPASSAPPAPAPAAPQVPALARDADSPPDSPTVSLISEFLRIVGVGPDVSNRVAEAIDHSRTVPPGAAGGESVAAGDKKDAGVGEAEVAPVGGDATGLPATAAVVLDLESTSDVGAPPSATGPEYGPAAPGAPSTVEHAAGADANKQNPPGTSPRRSLVARALDRLNEAPKPELFAETDNAIDVSAASDLLEIEIEVVVSEPRPHAPAGRQPEGPKPAKPVDAPAKKR